MSDYTVLKPFHHAHADRAPGEVVSLHPRQAEFLVRGGFVAILPSPPASPPGGEGAQAEAEAAAQVRLEAEAEAVPAKKGKKNAD